MKIITIKGVEYNCPQSWDEITLSLQIKVSRDSDTIENEVLKKIAILSGYASIPIDILKHCQLSELPALFENISFIDSPIPEKMINEFEFKGSRYYVGQNLGEMEFQDYISIENTLAEASGQTYNALPTILAIMCKRKLANGQLESINDYNVLERASEFYGLPISIANGLAVFFYNSVQLYKQVSLLYSNPKEIVEAQINSLNNTEKLLVGKGLLTKCANGILRILIRFIKRRLTKHYTSTV